MRAGFAALQALDPDSCRPFDHERAGLILGETAAAMLLSADAGPGVWLQGWGAAMDAQHLTGPARDGAGLRAACAVALQRGGGQLPGLIVAHGTGTRFNDDSEAAAYRTFAPTTPITAWKGLLGHSLGACGLTEAALCAAALASEANAPGIVGFRAGAGDLHLLPPGQHRCAAPWLSPNAGFGGLNAAVLIGLRPPQPLRAVTPRCTVRATLAQTGGVLDALSALAVLGRTDPTWGRMDLACRALVTLGVRLDQANTLPQATAVVLLTTAGSAAIDRVFERDRQAGTTAAQTFVYTLPTMPIGELSIRCGLRGPGLALLGASDDDGRITVAGLLAEGHPCVILARVESDAPPHTAWAECWSA